MKIVTVIALSVAAALAAPALSAASTYCVGDPGGSCDVSKPDSAAGLQAALTAADTSVGVADVVRIGPGSYTGNFEYSAPDELDIEGSGTGTIIKGVGTAPALWVAASGGDSVVSGVTFHLAAVADPQYATGLRIRAAVAQDVRVQNPAGAYGVGIELAPDGAVRDSTVLAGVAMGIQESGGAGQRDVSDSFIAGRHGVGASTGTWTLERLRVTGRLSGIQVGGTATLHDSLIRVLGEAGHGSVGIEKLGPGVLAADHVTIFGGPDASYGASSVITGPGTSTLNLKNAILAGTFSGSTFSRWAAGGGTANIVVGHSNFAPPTQSWVDGSVGPGVFQQTPSGTNTNLDPRFVDPLATLENPTMDFRLRHDSPLIDKGEPGGVQAQDLAGELRLVNGDGVDEPTRDMGAYEYQRRAPTAVIAGPGPGPFAAGAPLAFSAAGSGDPDAGDSIEYAWSFGDGASAAGEAPSHAYDSGGQRIVTLTVTDPTGLTATATSALLVDGPGPGPAADSGSGPIAGPGPGPGSAPVDQLAPAVSSLALSAPAFRVPRGTRVRFGLSEAATVRFVVQRRSGGRRIGSFVRAAGAGANSVRFAGRLRVHGRTLSLAPGRYRLTLVATDASGNRSAARRVFFRVVSPGG